MSVIESAVDNLRNNNRRILVCGPRATGKTSFSISASQFAGRHIEGDADESGKRQKNRQCKDVLVIQGDTEGILGAMDLGLIPGAVLDTTRCESWRAYHERVTAGLQELAEPLRDGTIKVVVVDLAFPAKLIEKFVEDQVRRGEKMVELGLKDWRLVANQGLALYRLFSSLLGVTVIGNAQIKPAFSGLENASAADAAQAKAIGGERSTFTVDLPKGIAAPWMDNCSFMFARSMHYTRERDSDGERMREYNITMQSSARYEAKSRAQNRLPRHPVGVSTLRRILEEIYRSSI